MQNTPWFQWVSLCWITTPRITLLRWSSLHSPLHTWCPGLSPPPDKMLQVIVCVCVCVCVCMCTVICIDDYRQYSTEILMIKCCSSNTWDTVSAKIACDLIGMYTHMVARVYTHTHTHTHTHTTGSSVLLRGHTPPPAGSQLPPDPCQLSLCQQGQELPEGRPHDHRHQPR